MLRIGLTGGIGSGKTTVSDHFLQLDVPVVDADVISRTITQPGQAAHDKIIAHFGSGVADDNGELSRDKLRERVFASESERLELEQILHPLIREEMAQQVDTIKSHYCILSIPLLVEGGTHPLVDRTLVVDAPDDLRRQWIRDRSGLDDEAIDAIFSAQASRDQRLAVADDVIVNDGTLKQLYRRVEQQHRLYLSLLAVEDAVAE